MIFLGKVLGSVRDTQEAVDEAHRASDPSEVDHYGVEDLVDPYQHVAPICKYFKVEDNGIVHVEGDNFMANESGFQHIINIT